MHETYLWLASFAQTGGLLLFVLGFLLVVAYVFWPSKARKHDFDEAANIPLKED
ncbi:cbb3-type cytochrome c oxidase subunit 3 [Xanthobacter autotrophicus DSM 431]|uniref:cbb3-type cytochrome c oxidase subunit 3 n=1 Tax=Xanthobacter nonsaccharivorans TaxID=3119912 RepID=UPI0037287579